MGELVAVCRVVLSRCFFIVVVLGAVLVTIRFGLIVCRANCNKAV